MVEPVPSVHLPSVHLVLGGARSGKSAFAESCAVRSGLEKIYVATGQVCDGEMAARADRHKQQRGKDWHTIEEPVQALATLQQHARSQRIVLVDCLTLWLTNLMLGDEYDPVTEIESLVAALPFAGPVIFVSNEVGQGIVPDNRLARRFRDLAGLAHQKIADKADVVTFVTAGLPQRLKG